jgi:hypothetical protein
VEVQREAVHLMQRAGPGSSETSSWRTGGPTRGLTRRRVRLPC